MTQSDVADLRAALQAAGLLVHPDKLHMVDYLLGAKLGHLKPSYDIQHWMERLSIADNLEIILGGMWSTSLKQKIDAAANAWFAARNTQPHQTDPEEKPSPREPTPLPCDVHAFSQFERAAHLLHMLMAGGVTLTKPAELNRLIGMLAATLSRRAPHVSRSDHDTASSAIAALEAAKLITVEPSRRQRVVAILGSALAIRS
mgnify:CR=1 FL=1